VEKEAFRTILKINKSRTDISHHQNIILMGSCFSEHMGQKLEHAGFQTIINPFGIVYNPVSLHIQINRLLNQRYYEPSELVHYNELWHSFDHHGSFSGIDNTAVCDSINKQLSGATKVSAGETTWLITLGTAYYYALADQQKVVSNCHKFPGSFFSKKRITIETGIRLLTETFEEIFQSNPLSKIILTVSPVRYLRDGIIENQRSKAILQLISESLCEIFPDRVEYFPAYELIMDDLRDYRFYHPDMAHPSVMAVDYIWENFRKAYFTEQTNTIYNQVLQWKTRKDHRPLYPQTLEAKAFEEATRSIGRDLMKRYPFLKLPED